MISSPTTYTLLDGATIPALGLGTYLSKKNEVAIAVESAVKAGYRHLDLAFIYGNQQEVGSALKNVIPSVVKREELFITTKLWNSSHKAADVEKEFNLSLSQLGLEYLDLYLMHWPVAMKSIKSMEIDTSVTVAETWNAMATLLKTGKVKSIGVSNFTIDHIRDLIAATGIKPSVNQVELHPLLHQDDLLAYCQKEGIHVTAYFPLGGKAARGRPSILDDPTVGEIAKKNNASPAQVLLAWGLSRGYSVIPKSINPERIKSNFQRVRLSEEDLKRIGDIGKDNQTRFVVPTMWKWDINIFGTEKERNTQYEVQITNGTKPRL